MQYTYHRTITDEEIVDIMESALVAITYWAGEAKFHKGTTEEMWLSEAIVRGNAVDIYDAEDEKWYTLTLDKFLRGLELRTSFDPNNWDAYDADAIVQYALFNELKYA